MEGRPMLHYTLDPATRRLHLRYKGFWSVAEALQAQAIFEEALDRAMAAGSSFTLLDDLSEWGAQSQEVVELNKRFVDLCIGRPISRNAMVIPQALLRMQVHRTLKQMENCVIFSAFHEAESWLREVEPQ